MRNIRNKYKRMKKVLIASAGTSIMAGMLLMGVGNTALAETLDYSAPAYTQNSTTTGMHMMRRWNSGRKVSGLAKHLGLDSALVTAELKSGKTVKQILQEHGIVPGQLGKAFESGTRHKDKNWKK